MHVVSFYIFVIHKYIRWEYENVPFFFLITDFVDVFITKILTGHGI